MYFQDVTFALTILTSFWAKTNAATISKRQFSPGTSECDGARAPKIDSGCQAAIDNICNSDGRYGPLNGAESNERFIYDEDSSNCLPGLYLGTSTVVVDNEQLCDAFQYLESTCTQNGAGGSVEDRSGTWSAFIYNNPQYSGSSNKAKRDDTSYTVQVYTANAKPSSKQVNIEDAVPGGTKITTTSSDEHTFSSSLSSSVSAGVEGIVSTEVGFDVSMTQTSKNELSTEYTCPCPSNQEGQLVFQPYFNIWEGTLSPSETQLTVMQPVKNSDGSTAGAYEWNCFSK